MAYGGIAREGEPHETDCIPLQLEFQAEEFAPCHFFVSPRTAPPLVDESARVVRTLSRQNKKRIFGCRGTAPQTRDEAGRGLNAGGQLRGRGRTTAAVTLCREVRPARTRFGSATVALADLDPVGGPVAGSSNRGASQKVSSRIDA